MTNDSPSISLSIDRNINELPTPSENDSLLVVSDALSPPESSTSSLTSTPEPEKNTIYSAARRPIRMSKRNDSFSALLSTIEKTNDLLELELKKQDENTRVYEDLEKKKIEVVEKYFNRSIEIQMAYLQELKKQNSK